MEHDPRLPAVSALATARLSLPSSVPGHPQSLSRGAAGIALLHIERAAQGLGDWDTAHAWLAAASSAPVSASPRSSAYLGAPALAFALHGAARHGRYARALAQVDHGVETLVRQRLEHAHARIDHRERPALREFDAINGLTGIGAHLLRHAPDGDLLTGVLEYLVRLTEPLGSDRLPGWWTGQPATGRRATGDDGGHSNNGMAHGIAGCLALLAISLRRGASVAGQAGAITRICQWLDAWQQPHPSGPWWPEATSREDALRGTPSQAGPGRPSWCYGTPGIARAQQLAAQALQDPGRQRLAEEAMTGCLTDPRQMSLITGPGLCHGAAGVFQAAWRMTADARHPTLRHHLPQLASRLLTGPPEDDPGALNGAAGLALAQTTAATSQAATGWDTFLLLN
jgi:lantibiotic biosynthesis protein